MKKTKNDVENVVCGAGVDIPASQQVSLEDTIKQLRKQVSGYQGYIKQLNAKIDELRGVASECEELVNKRNDYVKKLEKDVAYWKRSSDVALKELDALKTECENLNNQLIIEKSMPWYKRLFG